MCDCQDRHAIPSSTTNTAGVSTGLMDQRHTDAVADLEVMTSRLEQEQRKWVVSMMLMMMMWC